MALEHFLESVRLGELGAPGEFTISVDRAMALYSERALTDVWYAWLCLAQGFLRQGATSITITASRTGTQWEVPLPEPLDVADLVLDQRFLLGWLNLGWFGRPRWLAEEGILRVEWAGNAWRRYRMASNYAGHLGRGLRYAPVPIRLKEHSALERHLPVGGPLCLYPLAEGLEGGLAFEDAAPETRGFFERRLFGLETLGPRWVGKPGTTLAALASKTKHSWSEVSWVSHGVVISRQRNTLARPGVTVIASVEALGLETDLSGFQVITNDAYFKFLSQLKRDVLWML